MHRLGILLSGRGSNFLAIDRAIREGRLPDAEIAVVLSNRTDAPGLAAARDLGLRAEAVPAKGSSRVEHDERMVGRLREARTDLVCLAGYMRLLTPVFLRAFPQRVLNIHPSLLPAFPGLHAQRQALEYGVRVAGCSVHFVDEAVDGGVILCQRTVPVEDRDTEETLSARILEQEHQAYPEAIAKVLGGRFETRGRRYVLRDIEAEPFRI